MVKNSIVYQEIKPAEDLVPFIHSYWIFAYFPEDGQVLEHTIIPDGACSLLFSYQERQPIGPVLLFGPQEQNFVATVSPNSVTLGIRFMPGAVAAILDTSPEAFLNQTVLAQPLIEGLDVPAILSQFECEASDFSFLDKILDSWISRKTIEIDEKVQQAVQYILENGGNIKVGELPSMVFLSERQFQRRFRQAVGMSAKVFARIRRMRQAIIDIILTDKSYQDVVFDRGFFDRAHLSRDFSAIAGIPPKVLEEYLSRINHINVD